MAQNVDPITLQVFINILHTISDEMVASLVRTGYSTNIKDRRDCSCAIYNAKGEVIVQSELGTPLHLGTMSPTVQTVLQKIPIEKMDAGDAIIINKPYPAGPGHLNDLTMVSPVYYQDKVAGLVASMAHHVDMGGYAPGSMPFGVTEHYQEGLQIPPVKIIKKGVWDEEIFSLIKDNLRTEEEFGGDLRAQLGANNVGIMRLREVFEKYTLDKAFFYFAEVMNYSERRMRSMIKEIPNGQSYFEDFIEGDSIEERMIKIAATIDIKDEEIHVDFTGTDPEVKGPINCTISNAYAAVYYSIKSILDPDIPPNSGAYRPISIDVPHGCLLNSNFPKPVCNSNIITAQRIVDVIFGAFKDIIPERTCAACAGTMNLINIGGRLPGKQQLFNYIETYGGGQGAMFCQDGMSGVHTHMTNTRNAPVEALEIAYPFLVKHYGLVENSEGPGKFRGGFGMTRCIKFLGDQATITWSSDRHIKGPWGVFKGREAGGSKCFIRNSDMTRELPSKITTQIYHNDEIVLITPGGGGWEDPFDREPSMVLEDLMEGLITIERAKDAYGVVVDEKKMEIDPDKTDQLRSKSVHNILTVSPA